MSMDNKLLIAESNIYFPFVAGFGEPVQTKPGNRRIPVCSSRMLNAQSLSVDSDLQLLGIGNHLPQDKGINY